eukprot:TRINITY_DN947_c0_g1_i1.p1 TRINITY_DN947_c0_g1~~TRINITY_DN947_c0_g1_i1.p1  ORF type:complete len:209 (+),score=80.84 TRINITY_DN947_c0_g1_i1:73-627(+)
MCIRDRYQRRVHGEQIKTKKTIQIMMRTAIAILALLAIANCQNWADPFVGTYEVDSKCTSFSCKEEKIPEHGFAMTCPLAGNGNMKIVRDGPHYRIDIKKYQLIGTAKDFGRLYAQMYNSNELRVGTNINSPVWRIVKVGDTQYQIDRSGWGGKACNFGAKRTSTNIQIRMAGSNISLQPDLST